jgi:hypothetical protein
MKFMDARNSVWLAGFHEQDAFVAVMLIFLWGEFNAS